MLKEIKKYIEQTSARSKWREAVKADAIALLANCEELGEVTEQAALNGASSWSEYSWGGCALIYNGDIASHYCTPSEFKKVDGGAKSPNAKEEWLDVQTRALRQAWLLINEAKKEAEFRADVEKRDQARAKQCN